MSKFRKINLSKEDLDKNPSKISAKPVKPLEPISNTKLIKDNISETEPEEGENPNTTTETEKNLPDEDPQTSENGGEVPPGEPVNNNNTDNSEASENIHDSYDETGIDFSEWYFPQGEQKWINY